MTDGKKYTSIKGAIEELINDESLKNKLLEVLQNQSTGFNGVSLRSLLLDNLKVNEPKRIVIPFYQRDYVWGEEEIISLLEGLLPNSEDLSENDRFYFGNIILVKNQNVTNKNQNVKNGIGNCETIEIIDGQQRITTIYLLLKAVYDKYINNNDEDKKEIIKEIERFFYATEPLKGFVVEREYVNKDETTSNNYTFEYSRIDEKLNPNIDNAKNIIKNYIEKFDTNKLSDKIGKMLDCCDCTVYCVNGEHKSKAMQAFTACNTAGIKLDTADILKGQLFGFEIEQNSKADDFLEEKKQKIKNVWADENKTDESKQTEIKKIISNELYWCEDSIELLMQFFWKEPNNIINENEKRISDNKKIIKKDEDKCKGCTLQKNDIKNREESIKFRKREIDTLNKEIQTEKEKLKNIRTFWDIGETDETSFQEKFTGLVGSGAISTNGTTLNTWNEVVKKIAQKNIAYAEYISELLEMIKAIRESDDEKAKEHWKEAEEKFKKTSKKKRIISKDDKTLILKSICTSDTDPNAIKIKNLTEKENNFLDEKEKVLWAESQNVNDSINQEIRTFFRYFGYLKSNEYFSSSQNQSGFDLDKEGETCILNWFSKENLCKWYPDDQKIDFAKFTKELKDFADIYGATLNGDVVYFENQTKKYTKQAYVHWLNNINISGQGFKRRFHLIPFLATMFNDNKFDMNMMNIWASFVARVTILHVLLGTNPYNRGKLDRLYKHWIPKLKEITTTEKLTEKIKTLYLGPNLELVGDNKENILKYANGLIEYKLQEEDKKGDKILLSDKVINKNIQEFFSHSTNISNAHKKFLVALLEQLWSTDWGNNPVEDDSSNPPKETIYNNNISIDIFDKLSADNGASLELEHIFPQVIGEIETDENKKYLLNRLGNLSLLEKTFNNACNAKKEEIQRQGFLAKKFLMYSQGGYTFTDNTGPKTLNTALEINKSAMKCDLLRKINEKDCIPVCEQIKKAFEASYSGFTIKNTNGKEEITPTNKNDFAPDYNKEIDQLESFVTARSEMLAILLCEILGVAYDKPDGQDNGNSSTDTGKEESCSCESDCDKNDAEQKKIQDNGETDSVVEDCDEESEDEEYDEDDNDTGDNEEHDVDEDEEDE